MRNAEHAAFTDLRDGLRHHSAAELAEFWADPSSEYQLGRLHGTLEVLTGLPYSRGVPDELERAAKTAHRVRGTGPCECGKVRCGAIPVPWGSGTPWQPPTPAPRRSTRTVVPAVAAPNPPMSFNAEGLIDVAALFTGEFTDASLNALFNSDGRLAQRCEDRATLLALRWAHIGGDHDFDDLFEDVDRFCDARPVKGLRRNERWFRVGQYALFAGMAAPPEPFEVAGADPAPGVVVWWRAPEPVTVQGRTGTWVATIAGEAPPYTPVQALTVAADAGEQRHGEEFLGAFGLDNTGAVIATRERHGVQLSRVRRAPVWSSELQPRHPT